MKGAAAGREVPRISLTRREAADAVGMSVDTFERYVQPELRIVRLGRLRLIPVSELERWIAQNAERPLDRRERGELASGR